MFDIGWSELLVIAVIAIVVIGPRDLPAALRAVGKAMGTMRRMAAEFQGQFNEAMREAELDELRRDVTDLKNTAESALRPTDIGSIARNEIRGAIEKPVSSTPSATALAAGSATAAPLAELPDPPPPPSVPEPEPQALGEPSPILSSPALPAREGERA